MLQEKVHDKPIICNIDEAGQNVLELPKEISEHFDEIFQTIDADPEVWNIKQYNLRVSSLEEVFIEIGEREKREEAKLLGDKGDLPQEN